MVSVTGLCGFFLWMRLKEENSYYLYDLFINSRDTDWIIRV